MKIIKKIILSLIFMFMITVRVLALSVNNNNVTYEAGSINKMELFANTNEKIKSISFSFTFSNYDVSARFLAKTGFMDNVSNNTKHTITFDTEQIGKISLGDIEITVKQNPRVTTSFIRISNVSAVTSDNKTISLSNQTITVNIGTSEPDDENILEKIDSNIVKIDLEENKYEYDVEIDDMVEELDLKPKCKKETCVFEISNQKISELENMRVLITARDGDIEKIYTINVKVNEKQKDIILDNEEFVVDDSYKKNIIVIIILFSVGLITSLVFVFKKK